MHMAWCGKAVYSRCRTFTHLDRVRSKRRTRCDCEVHRHRDVPMLSLLSLWTRQSTVGQCHRLRISPRPATRARRTPRTLKRIIFCFTPSSRHSTPSHACGPVVRLRGGQRQVDTRDETRVCPVNPCACPLTCMCVSHRYTQYIARV